MKSVLCLLLGSFFLAASARANDQEAHFGAVGEAGARLHSGQLGKSFTEAVGAFFYFQAGVRRGFLRPSLGVALEVLKGNATIGAGKISGTGYGGGVYPGIELFPFGATRIQPFLEVHAIATWSYFSLSPVTPKNDESTLALAFGGQAGLGVDFKHHGGQRAFRIHASYSSYSAKVAGQTGFQLNCYALSLGMAF